MFQEDCEENGRPNGVFLNKPIGSLHKYYLSGAIRSPDHYTSWFEQIRTAGENDIIMIYINSYGGDAASAIQFLRVFSESRATIVASVEGDCMSAATFLFLAATYQEISDHSRFMFHNYSGGHFGKGGELYDAVTYSRPWSEELMKSVYKDFFSEDEIKAMLDNRDLWLTGKEVAERLTKRTEIRAKEAELALAKAALPPKPIAAEVTKKKIKSRKKAIVKAIVERPV
jgi:ATP-dependent protease ClpP protease subunit